jgi:glutathione peroxidase
MMKSALRWIVRCIPVFGIALAVSIGLGKDIVKEPTDKPVENGPLQFTVKDIDGKEQSLADYKGKVVLIVNVASKCGNTPQYKGLEALYEKYKDKGLVIIGFPANNFGGQEPGTNDQIKEFCSSKYNVAFPMMSKISVKGDDKAPLYKYLTEKETAGDFAGDVEWNFGKFLVDRNGALIGRFNPRTKPEEAVVTGAIEKALAAQPAK